MTNVREVFDSIAARDWRILFGIVVTLLWLGGGIWYVAQVGDPSSEFNFTQDSVASYLEDMFAPGTLPLVVMQNPFQGFSRCYFEISSFSVSDRYQGYLCKARGNVQYFSNFLFIVQV